jgi:hypothetical protein
MSLRRTLGSLFSPRRDVDRQPPAAEPCVTCGQADNVRTFSLNPPAPRQIDDDLRLWLSPGGLFTAADGHLVLYDPTRAQSHVLNPSAAVVWAGIDDGRRVADVIDGVVVDTGAAREVVDADVRRVIANLLELGIATDEPPASRHPKVPTRDDRWAPARRRALDRRVWPTVVGPVRAAGVDVVARTDVDEVAPTLHTVLGELPPSPDGAAEPVVISAVDAGVGRPHRFRLYVDGDPGWVVDEPARLGELFMSDFNQVVINDTPERLPGRLLLHAGAVERDGVVIAIAGDSGRGKSTLTARLVQDGWSYLSDELAAVDPVDLDVVPFPKPIDLDADARALLGLPARPADGTVKALVAPSELGRVSNGGRLALLVVLGDEPRADEVDTPPGVRSVLDLIGVTFGRTFDDPSALDALASLIGRVPIVVLPRSSIDDMAERVEAAFDRVPG